MRTLIPSTQYIQRLVHAYQASMKSHPVVANNWSLSNANWLKLLQLMANDLFSHNSGLSNYINELIEVCRYECTLGERSSAVEHTVHIGVVTGSIPVAPTTPRKYPSATIDQQRIAGLRPEPFRVFNAKETA